MKNILKIISFIFLFFALILESFAIDAPSNLKIDSNNNNSVTLSWDTDQNAFLYLLSYSTKSGLENGYDMMTDFIDTNNFTVNDLEVGNTYYFSVIALDENGEESIFSNEVMIDIVDSNIITKENIITSDSFVLDSINVILYNVIELSFNYPLDDGESATREFKVVNKNDSLDTFDVITTELNSEDPSKIFLTLDRETTIGEEYEVVVVAIMNNNGENIESGIDSVETFMVEEIFVEEPIVEEIVELNSAVEKDNGPSGSNLSVEEVNNTTIALANNSSNLPKTGPEHILMLILSIILGALVFIFKYKKA